MEAAKDGVGCQNIKWQHETRKNTFARMHLGILQPQIVLLLWNIGFNKLHRFHAVSGNNAIT